MANAIKVNGKTLRAGMVVELTEREPRVTVIITNVNVKAHEVESHGQPVVNTTNGYVLVSNIKRIVPTEEVL
jgi:hypothetical protein